MDNYVLGLIWSRDDRARISEDEMNRIQASHMEHIGKMASIGALVGAGPILDAKSKLRGFFIFKTSLEDATKLANADPTVTNNRNRIELLPWYTQKGLGEPYKRWAAANPGARDTMVTFSVAVLRVSGKRPEGGEAAQQRLQGEHFAYVDSLMKSGKLAAAGPFTNQGQKAGIFVFRTSMDEARELAAKEPFVAAGVFEIDWYPWMASPRLFPSLEDSAGK